MGKANISLGPADLDITEARLCSECSTAGDTSHSKRQESLRGLGELKLEISACALGSTANVARSDQQQRSFLSCVLIPVSYVTQAEHLHEHHRFGCKRSRCSVTFSNRMRTGQGTSLPCIRVPRYSYS